MNLSHELCRTCRKYPYFNPRREGWLMLPEGWACPECKKEHIRKETLRQRLKAVWGALHERLKRGK